ncbi:MAG: hypothetical protein AB7O96_08190, partial [Pseudobdellovibrionaceae bacterium]
SPYFVTQLADGVNLSVGDPRRKGVLKTVMMSNPKSFVVSSAVKAAKASKYANHVRNYAKGGK